jgi:two-component system chemotaxis response regulator CheY
MRVLLVEDNEVLRHLFSRVLRARGFDVTEAGNGRDALDQLVGYEPNLVITDVMMPVMDGVEFIRNLRQIPTMASVPVVAITADGTAETERRVREAGAIDFIVKPVDIPTLLERLYGPGGRESGLVR